MSEEVMLVMKFLFDQSALKGQRIVELEKVNQSLVQQIAELNQKLAVQRVVEG